MERTGENRITSPFLTKYEKARLLGARATAISLNAKVVSNKSITDSLSISEEELKSKTLPLKIRRNLPDGTFEIWKVEELIF
jgi:DNA-directed RNA polymerase I, II, and III subunit RPABC2